MLTHAFRSEAVSYTHLSPCLFVFTIPGSGKFYTQVNRFYIHFGNKKTPCNQGVKRGDNQIRTGDIGVADLCLDVYKRQASNVRTPVFLIKLSVSIIIPA